MLALVSTIPELTVASGDKLTDGYGVLYRGTTGRDGLISITAAKVQLQSALGATVGALTSAGDTNPALRADLAPKIAALQTAGDQVLANMDMILEGRLMSVGFDRWMQDSQALMAATASAAELACGWLGDLLTVRIDGLNNTLWTVMASVAASLLFAGVLAFFLLRRILNGLGDSLGHFASIQSGDLTQTIVSSGRDEVGQLVAGLSNMQETLRMRGDRDAQLLAENTRVKQSLDFVSTAVMIADTDGQLIYLNDSASAMMQASKANLNQVLVGFDADQLVGTHFDVFYSHSNAQRSALNGLNNTHQAEIEIGRQRFVLTANPVNNDQGERLGAVIEWQDVTAERQIEAEIGKMVVNAANGHLSDRIDLEGKHGFHKVMAEG